MERLRLLLAFCAALLLIACKPPAQVTPPPVVVSASELQGQLILPEGYQTQANASQVRANATVTLIDPATFQAKGTGITASDGTFTVRALPTFTPAVGGLYLLESNKTLGGAGNAAFRLRTLVQFTTSGWTSVSGAAVQLSTATTAVALLWDHHGLAAANVLSKVTYEAVTRTHRFSALTTTLTEEKLREVEALVNEALLLNVDPIHVVRPGSDGKFGLSLSDRPRNQLVNGSFEEGGTGLAYWKLNNPGIASWSAETGVVFEGKRSIKLTVNAAGDTWFGQGWNDSTDTFGIQLATGTAYTFSVYARGAVGGEKLALCLNYQKPFFEVTSPTFILSTSWQRYSWTLVAANTTDRAFFMLRNGSGIGQATFPSSVYVDAVQLETGGAATDYGGSGSLLQEGFANSLESTGVTFAQGRSGRAVMVDNWLNVIPSNSSFETDSNADGIPDGMTLISSGATYSLDPEALFDTRSLKIEKSTATGTFVGYPLTHTFKPGKTYTFSVWVKGQNVQGPQNASDFALYVDALPVTGGYEVFSTAMPVGTFDWTRVTATHTFSKECGAANVYPIFRNKTGTVWFDGLQVEENGQASPYAGNFGADRLSFDAAHYSPYQGTISFWYKPTYNWASDKDLGDTFGLVNASGNELLLVRKSSNQDGTNRLTLGSWDGTTSQGNEWRPSGTPWVAGTWHHLALTWGNRGVEFFLDGEQVSQIPYFGPINAGSPFSRLCFAGNNLGANYLGGTNGLLDGLKVWDLQKSPEAVRREYLGF